MELLDDTDALFGDDLKQAMRPAARLKIAASCFSTCALEALRAELKQIEEFQFIFTAPTFVAEEVSDKIRKERKEFHIPKLDREYGVRTKVLMLSASVQATRLVNRFRCVRISQGRNDGSQACRNGDKCSYRRVPRYGFLCWLRDDCALGYAVKFGRWREQEIDPGSVAAKMCPELGCLWRRL